MINVVGAKASYNMELYVLNVKNVFLVSEIRYFDIFFSVSIVILQGNANSTSQ